MKLNRLFQITAVLAVVFAFIGCDEDFSEIGGEIINNPSNVEIREVAVNAYSQKIKSIQTNNLSSFILGVNNHPVYGESAASLITQLSLSTEDPDFGENVQLDSVVMTIPYFSTQTDVTEGGDAVYKLDSIYGNESFKLSVYETSFFLNDLDPSAGFEERQKYYSDQLNIIEQNIVGHTLFVKDDFKPSELGYTSYEIDSNGENDTIVNAPAFRIKLPVEYFQNKIVAKEGSIELLNNDNFHNYLRSLLIKAESNNTEGSQVLLNFAGQNASPKISLYYMKDSEGEDVTEKVRGSYNLNITGNKFNTFEGEFPDEIEQSINAQTAETGAEALYLKGEEGSMAVIELFPDSAELEAIRAEELLINEADLVFYVNKDLTNGAEDPLRLYLYDLTNNTFLADYALDITYSLANPNASLVNFAEPVQEDETGTYYKIRITNHVSNVINVDTENVKLGLVVVPNMNSVVIRGQQGATGTPIMSATRQMPELISRIPSVNSLTPQGTILHGNLSNDVDKRLRLKIYYTNFN